MSLRKKILIVEDHESVASALSFALDLEGRYDVCGVAGALAEAYPLMRETVPDLVIVDLNLPDGSGLNLIEGLREIAPVARYLMYSAESAAAVSGRARDAGANGYLEKGASLDVLLEVVTAILEGEEHFPGLPSVEWEQ
jgi:DNA-binding NarL/FixJ family response regulator